MMKTSCDSPCAHGGEVVDEISGYSIIDCKVCGFVHVNPLPVQNDVKEIYQEEYYTREKPYYLEHTLEDEDWLLTISSDRYARFEAVLEEGRRRLIDIGSGPGIMLKAGAARGWDVLGIEPSRQAAEFSRGRGLNIVEGFFDREMAASLEPADVVHLHNVLEHIPDPRGFVALAWELVRPGGLICIGVPNDYNPLQKTLRDVDAFRPWWVAPPHHLNYFSFDSLEGLLKGAGFTVLERLTTFPMELFLLMGDNYVGNDKLGRSCHSKRKSFDLKLETAGRGDVRRTLYRALADNGIGREAIVIARKE